MHTFKLRVTRDCTFTQSADVEVQAKDRDEAIEKATEMPQDSYQWETDEDSFHYGEDCGVYVADPDEVEEVSDLVYVVRGVHYSQPGELMSLHSTRALAEARALELVNLILDDLGEPHEVRHWEKGLACIKKAPGGNEADVCISTQCIDIGK